jgi:hypothetical protein
MSTRGTYRSHPTAGIALDQQVLQLCKWVRILGQNGDKLKELKGKNSPIVFPTQRLVKMEALCHALHPGRKKEKENLVISLLVVIMMDSLIIAT